MSILKKRNEITKLVDNIKNLSDKWTGIEEIPVMELSVLVSKINRLHEKTVVLRHLLAQEQNFDLNTLDSEMELMEENILKEDIAEEEVIVPIFSENVEEGQEIVEEKIEEEIEEELDFEEEAIEFTSKELEENEEQIIEETEEIIKEIEQLVETVEVDEEETEEEEIYVEMEVEGDFSYDDEEQEEQAEDMGNVPEEEAEKPLSWEEIEEKTDIQTQNDLNESLAEEDTLSVEDKLNQQPIENIFASIGLNERYLYANELFNGNLSSFKEAMESIEQKGSWEEANVSLEGFSKEYNWEEDSELATALLTFVKRKFNN